MESISLKVKPSVAKAFRQASDDTKRKAEVLVNTWLENIFNTKPAAQKLEQILDKGADEAAKNGFRPEMLDDLLKNE